MIAFDASVELRWRLISTPGLKETPESLVVATLGTIYLCSWKGIQLCFLVSHDLDLARVGKLILGRLHNSLASLVGIAAVVAEICYHQVVSSLDLL